MALDNIKNHFPGLIKNAGVENSTNQGGGGGGNAYHAPQEQDKKKKKLKPKQTVQYPDMKWEAINFNDIPVVKL
ncbi:hypothetical protein ACFL96_00145 [Thermoproteota archaeon]